MTAAISASVVSSRFTTLTLIKAITIGRTLSSGSFMRRLRAKYSSRAASVVSHRRNSAFVKVNRKS